MIYNVIVNNNTRKKRIAIIADYLTVSGGAQRQTLMLADSLVKEGCVVVIYCIALSNDCFPEIAKKLTIKPIVSGNIQIPSIPSDWNFIKRLITLVRNIISENNYYKKVAYMLSKDNHVKPYDSITIHDSKALPIVHYLNKLPKPSWLMNDSPFFIDYITKGYGKLANNFVIRAIAAVITVWFILFVISKIGNIIVLDKRNQKIVKKYFKIKAHIVRSGLNFHKHKIRENRKKVKYIKVLTVNIFFPHRRYEDIVEAAVILRSDNRMLFNKLRFVFIGKTIHDDGYAKLIKQMVIDNNLQDKFEFIESVTEKELCEHYLDSDIFLYPNHNQTWGLAVFEAMSHGLPVIVSKTSGASEVLKNNYNAILIREKSPKSIVDAIKKLSLKRNSNIIAKNGKYFVKKNISWSRFSKQVLNLL